MTDKPIILGTKPLIDIKCGGLCNEVAEQFHLRSRCHGNAPLRAQLDNIEEDGRPVSIVTLFCYVPTCNKVVARMRVSEFMKAIIETKPGEPPPPIYRGTFKVG